MTPNTITVAGQAIKVQSLTDGQMTALYRIYEIAQMPNLDGRTVLKEMVRAERILLACIIDSTDREFVGEQLELGQVTLIGIMNQIFEVVKAETEAPAEPVRRPRGRPRKSV